MITSELIERVARAIAEGTTHLSADTDVIKHTPFYIGMPNSELFIVADKNLLAKLWEKFVPHAVAAIKALDASQ